MRKVSGIRFSDSRFLRDFEREARCHFAPEESAEIFNSYTVHRLSDGVILEFRDMACVATFLEKARAVGLAGRTFRIVKLVTVAPTSAYLTPTTDVDRWARPLIERAGEESRQPQSLIFTAAAYEQLREDFSTAGVELEHYVA